MAAGRLVDAFYLPEPTGVAAELWLWISDGSLFGHIMATLVPAVQGFLVGSIAAFALGYVLAMARSAAGSSSRTLLACMGFRSSRLFR